MKPNPHAVAAVLRSRTTRGAKGDQQPVESREPPATAQEPPVRILDIGNDRDVPGVQAGQSSGQGAFPDTATRDTTWLSLLGIAIILYLLALIFILF